jgi:hypothetical protein
VEKRSKRSETATAAEVMEPLGESDKDDLHATSSLGSRVINSPHQCHEEGCVCMTLEPSRRTKRWKENSEIRAERGNRYDTRQRGGPIREEGGLPPLDQRLILES